jgi:hypothetical protein
VAAVATDPISPSSKNTSTEAGLTTLVMATPDRETEALYTKAARWEWRPADAPYNDAMT